MSSLWFIFKISLLTIFLVWFGQIRFGESTVEQRVASFLRSPTLAQPIDTVAQGARQITSDAYSKINRWIGFGSVKNSEKKRLDSAKNAVKHKAPSNFRWGWDQNKDN